MKCPLCSQDFKHDIDCHAHCLFIHAKAYQMCSTRLAEKQYAIEVYCRDRLKRLRSIYNYRELRIFEGIEAYLLHKKLTEFGINNFPMKDVDFSDYGRQFREYMRWDDDSWEKNKAKQLELDINGRDEKELDKLYALTQKWDEKIRP